MTTLFITPHAMERFRERWRDTNTLSDNDLRKVIRQRLERALADGKYVDTPGGRYVPLSWDGKDGYAVMHGSEVVTVQLKEMCEEVNNLREFF